MTGAAKARQDEWRARRDLALMTAHYTARLTQLDWEKSRIDPDFNTWLTRLTTPQKVTAIERLKRFETLQRLGFAVSVNRTQH